MDAAVGPCVGWGLLEGGQGSEAPAVSGRDVARGRGGARGGRRDAHPPPPAPTATRSNVPVPCSVGGSCRCGFATHSAPSPAAIPSEPLGRTIVPTTRPVDASRPGNEPPGRHAPPPPPPTPTPLTPPPP